MTSLLSEDEKANLHSVAKIELPQSLLAEIDVQSIGSELKQAVDHSRSSQRQLAAAQDAKWWQFWRWGEKNKAIVSALMSMQEYQQATTKISAYNIWLSHKVLETEEVLQGQNDRIESAQNDIKEKMAEADFTLTQFRKEVTKVRDDLIHYLREAERERQSLSVSADKAERLLIEYAERAEIISSQIEMAKTLSGRVDKIGQWAKDFAPAVNSNLNSLRSYVSESSAGLNSRLEVVRSELETKFLRRYKILACSTALAVIVSYAFSVAVWLRVI